MIQRLHHPKSHSKNAFIYALAHGFERASYYGLRSIIVLFMIGETIKMDRMEAIEFYGTLTLGMYAAKLVGALIGDLLVGNRKAILIGGALQVLGCLSLCLQSKESLFIGVIMYVLGSGLFSSNVIAQFGKQYLDRPKLLDSGFTGLYLFINIGALGSVLVTGIMGDNNYVFGFIFCAVLILIASLLVYLTKDEIQQPSRVKYSGFDYDKKIYFMVIASLLCALFWGVYELASGFTTFFAADGILDYNLWLSITQGIGLVLGLLFTIVWIHIYTNQFFKFFLGLVIATLSIGILIVFGVDDQSSSILILISSGLLAFSEILLAPMVYSVAVRYSNPKYLAIVLSLVIMPVLLFNKLSGLLSKQGAELGSKDSLIIVFFLLIAGVTIAFLMAKSQQKDSTSFLSEEAQEFLS